jgi:hypothetical protein
MSEDTETIEELPPHREIAEFIAEGLTKGDPVVVISTPETRRGIEAHLKAFGARPDDLGSWRKTHWFDSHRILGKILVNGMPDPAEFDRVMNGILFNGFSMAPGRRIRTCHDLVDVLRDQGSLDAAVQVLRLWKGLCARYEELLLAYTVADLYRETDCAV